MTHQVEALDALGRPLKVGDHVAWGVKGALRLGFVNTISVVLKIKPNPSGGDWISHETLEPYVSHYHVTASDGNGHSMGRSSKAFVAIVLPDIQEAYKQVIGEDEMLVKKDYHQFLLDHCEGHMRMDDDGATRGEGR
jgi:hypothetical protein